MDGVRTASEEKTKEKPISESKAVTLEKINFPFRPYSVYMSILCAYLMVAARRYYFKLSLSTTISDWKLIHKPGWRVGGGGPVTPSLRKLRQEAPCALYILNQAIMTRPPRKRLALSSYTLSKMKSKRKGVRRACESWVSPSSLWGTQKAVRMRVWVSPSSLWVAQKAVTPCPPKQGTH